jgi:hypothetical protein
VTVTFIRDTAPPNLVITSPANGFVINTPNITITGTVDDPEATVRLGYYGPQIPVVNGAFTTQAKLSLEGVNYLTISASDPSGNYSYAQLKVTLDTLPPQINVTTPAQGAAFHTSTIPVGGAVIDPNIETINVAVNNGQPQPLTLTGSNFSGTITLTAGPNTLTFSARDKAGNTSSTTTTVLLDPGPPAVSITAPASGTLVSGIVNVTVEASDDMSGLGSVALYVDNQLYAALTQSPFNFSLNTSGLTSGSHALTAKATDRAGNMAQASINLLIDADSPSVTITSPPSGATVSGTITVTVQASDVSSGIASVSLFVDGVSRFSLNQPPFNFVLDTSALATGSHTIMARAVDKAGNQQETSLTISVAEGFTIVIISPVNGATVNKPTVLVQGKIYNKTGEIGVTINGYLVEVQGSDYAVIVPLQLGQNILTATATSADGLQAQTSATINTESQEEVLRLTGSPSSGILDPLTNVFNVTFEAETYLVNPIASYSWDFNGDGTSEVTGVEAAVTCQYQFPGLYFPKVTVTDDQGNVYSETTIVNVLSREETDALLRSKWDGMKGALYHQDIGKGLDYFLETTKEIYQQAFNVIIDELPQIVSDMQDIEMIFIMENIAKYRINRVHDIDGTLQTITYYIYFAKGPDGLWKIERF